MDEKAAEEGQQALADPEENSEALQPTGESGIPVPWPSLGVEVMDIPVPGTHTGTPWMCRELPTTPHTPSPGIPELWGFPPGAVKRFSSAEDTKTDPNAVEGTANTGTDDPKMAWSILGRIFLAGVIYAMMVLLVVKVAPAWAMDIKE